MRFAPWYTLFPFVIDMINKRQIQFRHWFYCYKSLECILIIIFLNPPTTLSKIPIVLPGTLLLLVDAVGWKISGLKLLFFGSLLMFCCCSLNLKDEAIQVMECHKVRHSLGSTLLNQTSQS